MVHKLFKVTDRDKDFFQIYLENRMPERIFDAHVHLALPEHTANIDPTLLETDWAIQSASSMSVEQLGKYASCLFPGFAYEFLALPLPMKGVDLEANNHYISCKSNCALMAVDPCWETKYCEELLLTDGCAGFKPYPNLVSTTKGAEISIFEFITNAQLRLLDKHKKAVLLHLPRALRLPDDDNIRELREIRHTYPDLKIVVAHFGRCFNIEPFLEGVKKLGVDIEGFYFDTAAVLNPQVYAAAFDLIAPEKIIFGTDLPIMLWHGKRTWFKGGYQNLCREDFKWNKHTEGNEEEDKYTFFIYEQLKNILDCIGNDEQLKHKVFYENAEQVYTV